MVYVTRKEHFNAAHRLFNPAWSEEKNVEVFGVCANKNWHGHNFELIVTVKGMPDINTGFVIDLKKLSHLIRVHIIEHIDHKNLDLDVPFLKGKLTSCENLVIAFWNILKRALENDYPSVSLHGMKLIETPNNYVEYFG